MQLIAILMRGLNLLSNFKKLFKPLEKTIFHPQWISYRNQQVLVDWLESLDSEKIVLDIGCANRWPEKHLTCGSQYIGLDYPQTATERYNSKVDIYANSEDLPFAEKTIDIVVLFDVLEHISDAEKALKEIHRVLNVEGRALIQVPFMYPIHDAPYDYIRPTKYGLEILAKRNNFIVSSSGSRGKPLETALLLTNIALVKSLINGMEKNIFLAGPLIPVVGVISTILNCIGWLVSKICSDDEIMPFSYHIVLTKMEI